MKIRTLNGYRVIYMPQHHRSMTSSNWSGWIYEHIVVAEKLLDRSLNKDEVIHHLDGNRSNNRFENLLVIERSQHSKLHAWLDSGAPFVKTNGVHGVNSGKPKLTEPKYCPVCNLTLQRDSKKYCSPRCAKLVARKVFRPSKEELEIKIGTKSWLALGREYGVSDNAVRKWARQYKLI